MSSEVPSDVLAVSRRALSVGSKSFASAARLLGPTERESATLLYAWCRYCDDVIDGQELGHARGEAIDDAAHRLAEITVKTRSVLRGRPAAEPAFAALEQVLRRHSIPHRYPMELLEGFAMDVEGRRLATLEDVLRYCYHVAGVVGLMMAHVMGVRDETALDRACDLGLALQLTNIARDVLDDAAMGRVYLPSDWLAAEKIPLREVALPRHRAGMARVVARLLHVADEYYRSADIGLRSLPLRSAWSIAVARGVYSDIGNLVQRRGAAAWSERTVVSRARKLAWVLRGAERALRAHALERFVAEPGREHLWERPRSWRPASQTQSFSPASVRARQDSEIRRVE